MKDVDLVEWVARALCIEGGYKPDQKLPNDTLRWWGYSSSARAAINEIITAMYTSDQASAAGVLREMAKPVPNCQHEWIDARNEHVISGEICLKCNAVRPGDETVSRETPVADETIKDQGPN